MIIKRNTIIFSTAIVSIIYCCLFFTICASTENQVAVVIGGWNGTNAYTEIEVWNHIHNNAQQNCTDTGEPPHVPDFPFPVLGASAVYLPDIGIYVCGGVNTITWENSRDCHKYNPRESRR